MAARLRNNFTLQSFRCSTCLLYLHLGNELIVLEELTFYTPFYKNVVFSAQAKYSYFSADFRMEILLYYYY